MRDFKQTNPLRDYATMYPGSVAEGCRERLAAVHKCYSDNYSNQDLYWEAKEIYLKEKAEGERTKVTKKVRVQIEDFVKAEKALTDMTFTDRITPAQLKYVSEMAVKHGKETLYAPQIEESKRLQKILESAPHDVKVCTNPFCKCINNIGT